MSFGLPARFDRDVIRVEAHLTPEQDRDLRARAAEEGVEVTVLLRRGVDLVLRAPPGDGWEQGQDLAD
jgi:hypothetical protein